MNILRTIKIKSLDTPRRGVLRLYLNGFSQYTQYEKNGCIYLVIKRKDLPDIIHYRYSLNDKHLYYDYNRVWMHLKYNLNVENVHEFIYNTFNKFGVKVDNLSFDELQDYR